MHSKDDLIIKAETLRNLLLAGAEGAAGANDLVTYVSLRRDLLARPETTSLVPRFVKTCPDLGAFWAFIKEQSSEVPMGDRSRREARVTMHRRSP